MHASTRRSFIAATASAVFVGGEMVRSYATPPLLLGGASRQLNQHESDDHQWVAADGDRTVSRVTTLEPTHPDADRVVVTAMAADPRGELLAVSGDDHVIRVFHVETMRLIRTLGEGRRQRDSSITHARARPESGHTDLIRTLAFDAQGDRLASAGNDGRLILWDRRRDFRVMQEIGSAPALACVQFDRRGHMMAAVGFDREIFLIGRTAAKTPTLRCDCNDLRCCRFRADDRMLVVAGRDGHVHFFDTGTGRETTSPGLRQQSLHQGRIRSMAFVPESDVLVTVAEDGTLVQLDTQRQQILSRTKITSGRLFSVVMTDRDHMVTAGSDDQLYVIRRNSETTSVAVIETLTGHVGSIATLDAVGSNVFSGGFDATIRRWDLSASLRAENKIARGGEQGSDGPQTGPR